MAHKLLNSFAAWMVLTVSPLAADEFDWTGTYEGFVVCDNVTSGFGGSFGRPMTLAIIQTGDRIDARNTVEVEPSQGTSHTVFRGRTMASHAGDWVSGYLEVCDATFPHKEMIRIFPASTGGASFGFAADTVFVSEAVPGTDDKLTVESCKWSLSRTSTGTPDFEPCR